MHGQSADQPDQVVRRGASGGWKKTAAASFSARQNLSAPTAPRARAPSMSRAVRLLAAAAALALALVADAAAEVVTLKTRVEARRRVGESPGDGYFSIDDQSQFGATYPFLSTMCTNAGGKLWTGDATEINSPLTVPAPCLPRAKMTASECTDLNRLWNLKFNYCCVRLPRWCIADSHTARAAWRAHSRFSRRSTAASAICRRPACSTRARRRPFPRRSSGRGAFR